MTSHKLQMATSQTTKKENKTMTIELDAIIKNLKNRPLSLELYSDGDSSYIYIETENSTGAEYKIQTIADIGQMITYYLRNYFE